MLANMKQAVLAAAREQVKEQVFRPWQLHPGLLAAAYPIDKRMILMMSKMNITLCKTGGLVAALLLATGLSGCANSWYPFVYKPPVYQGNMINPNAVAQLKTGMTKSQVINLMGNPVLDTPLSPNTWHYVYTLREKGKLVEHRQLTLYFSGDHLARIES